MAARFVKASTTVRPGFVRNAGVLAVAKAVGVTQSDAGPSVTSARKAFLRSSCAGKPLEGNAPGRPAAHPGLALQRNRANVRSDATPFHRAARWRKSSLAA